jgi:hypothetical protein
MFRSENMLQRWLDESVRFLIGVSKGVVFGLEMYLNPPLEVAPPDGRSLLYPTVQLGIAA